LWTDFNAPVPFGPVIYRWFALDMARPTFATADTWYQRLAERPAFFKVVMKPLS
jgi:hypothetical protein